MKHLLTGRGSSPTVAHAGTEPGAFRSVVTARSSPDGLAGDGFDHQGTAVVAAQVGMEPMPTALGTASRLGDELAAVVEVVSCPGVRVSPGSPCVPLLASVAFCSGVADRRCS